MREPAFSPLAVEDLRGIPQYISRDNPERAVTFLEILKEKCRTLARFPLLGTSRDNLIPGLRVFSAGSYVIYYRPEADSVRIERVLHGARDIDALWE